MIYRIMRALLAGALGQFFKGITRRGAPLVEEGPLIVACNHPNFALDSMMVGSAYRRDLWYLAKSTLFSNPLMAWFLTEMHVIPIYRKQDNPEEMGKNEEVFARAVDCLQKRGALAIFPEGVSMGERRLAPIKTGAARIALQAAAAADFKLGLKIQPLGITYANLHEFRSTATVHAGEPLLVDSYKSSYERDAIEAVRLLTAEIEDALKKLTVQVDSAEHEALVEKITALFRSRGSALDDYERMQIVARNVERLAPKFPEKRAEIESKLEAYLGLAGLFRIEGSDSLESKSGGPERAVLVPLVVCGALIWYLPYRLTGTIANRLADSPVSAASYKFGIGVGLFLLWALLLSIVFGARLWGIAGFFATFALVGALGVIVNRRLSEVRLYLWSTLWPGRDSPVSVVRTLRDTLVAELESLRVE
jgi:1-acyl-sn-glycerol-3-phosphate acyltransferase